MNSTRKWTSPTRTQSEAVPCGLTNSDTERVIARTRTNVPMNSAMYAAGERCSITWIPPVAWGWSAGQSTHERPEKTLEGCPRPGLLRTAASELLAHALGTPPHRDHLDPPLA